MRGIDTCEQTKKPMRATLITIIILLSLALSPSVHAAEMYSVTEADKSFLAEVLDAIHKNDTEWIAGHMVYPLSVVVSNRTRTVKSKEEFAPILRRELTRSLRSKIVDAGNEAPFKNWQGAMIGRGLLWFSEYQRPGDESWTYGIWAIGYFAFQPEHTMPPKEAASQLELYPANAAGLASKLGISDADWLEIEALIKLEKDEGNKPYELVCLERNPFGGIGAWLARHTPGETRPHGPVFFYIKDNGCWHRSKDMSEWGDP